MVGMLSLLMNEVSKYGVAAFVRYADRNLAPDLFLKAVQDNECVQMIDPGRIVSVQSALERNRNVAESRVNPEIYPAINRLMYSSSPEAISIALDQLELHVCCKPVEDSAARPDGFYRLAHSHGAVYRSEGGKITKVPAVFESGPGHSLIYRPMNGLFADILGAELYPPASDRVDFVEVREPLQTGCRLLEEFSEEHEDFEELISSIVVLPPRLKGTASFSWRLNYFGGIFVDVVGVNVFRLAESLIHEYLHQRLWQWWAYEELAGAPPLEVMIESPLTKQQRSAQVMLQAAIIYTAAVRFYQRARAEGSFDEVAGSRLDELSAGIPELINRLKSVIEPDSKAAVLLEVLGQLG